MFEAILVKRKVEEIKGGQKTEENETLEIQDLSWDLSRVPSTESLFKVTQIRRQTYNIQIRSDSKCLRSRHHYSYRELPAAHARRV